jgi:hypothetical protein
MAIAFSPLNGGILVLSLFLLKRLVQRLSKNDTLPPGPYGYPIIGSLLDWPSHQEWKTFSKWAEVYGKYHCYALSVHDSCRSGDIVHVNLVGQHIVILNSIEAALKLLHQKGGLCSNRPHLTFAGDLVGWKDFMALADDGQFLKEQRQLVFQEMGTKVALDRFTPMMEAKTHDFIAAMLDDPSPGALPQHIRT